VIAATYEPDSGAVGQSEVKWGSGEGEVVGGPMAAMLEVLVVWIVVRKRLSVCTITGTLFELFSGDFH